MSWVANVLVSTDPSDTDVIASLNEWLRERCPWNELEAMWESTPAAVTVLSAPAGAASRAPA